MQENKTKNIEVRAIGKPSITALSESEQQVFYTTLLKRINSQIAKNQNRCGLRIKRAFVLGAEGLRHNIFRLICSILLSVITFIAFGFSIVSLTMDSITAELTSLKSSNQSLFVLSSYNVETVRTGENSTKTIFHPFTDKQLDVISKYNKGDFVKLTNSDIYSGEAGSRVFGIGQFLNLSTGEYNNKRYNNPYYYLALADLTNFVELNPQTGMKDANLTIDSRFINKEICRLPLNEKEIAITDLRADTFIEFGFKENDGKITKISTPDDLIGKKLGQYTICGVFSTEIDREYFDLNKENVLKEDDNSFMRKYFYAASDSIITYGFVYNDSLIDSTISKVLIKSNGNISNTKKMIADLTYEEDGQLFDAELLSVYSRFVLDEVVMDYVTGAALGASIVLAVFAGLLLMNFLSVNISGRKKQLGILRALGARKKDIVAGLYLRLSQEDERQGESLSIENQRRVLRKYAEDNGFEIYGEYIDDGVSGTTFQRPEVQRLLDDAKTGVINTIIVKDLSRFGRNYIEVGQYLDYVFPAFGIRFIAIQDNVDTENRDSGEMEMMPIMNVFNEWHAANTSKKIRAVRRSNALAGIYSAKKATYGYLKGADKKRTPVIDEETAPVVRRIFELYASGISPKNIADILNAEGISSPGKLAYEKLGHKGRPNEMRLWCEVSIRFMLNNIMYIGHLPMLQETTVSYKNHKRQAKDRSDWVITYNNHEPIISEELWDKVQERQKHMAQGRKTKSGYVHPLSGFLVCADCGSKMKMSGHFNKAKTEYRYHFNCGNHLRYGKTLCFSHYIPAKDLEEIVLGDIREMAQRIVLDEKAIREEFIRHNAELADKSVKATKKELQVKRKRVEELFRLMQIAYEDRMKGKIPEDLCVEFLKKYSEEQKRLEAEIKELEARLTETANTIQSADEFIRNIKKYLEAPELTREMCYELLDRVVVGGLPKITGKERVIDIVYKVDIASVLRYKFK